jgi:hypothetical protein
VAESVSALVSACCAAALDRFPLVAGMKSHSMIKSIMIFLGLFAPVHAQDVQIRSTAHMVLPADFLLLEQSYNIILMLQKE